MISVGAVRHYPPVKIIEQKPRSGRYLCAQERVLIADLRATGATVRAIAREIGRSPSAVSRELGRNCDAHGG